MALATLLLEHLHTATGVAITSTTRGLPTEVELSANDGLKQRCCANLANIFTVPQSDLRRFVGAQSATRRCSSCVGHW